MAQSADSSFVYSPLKLLLLLLLLASSALAQPARRIPDAALRRVLARQGFLTNGVLNDKSRRWDQLYISGEGIQSLEGIQYFTHVEWLTVRDTRLTALTHLPPRLKYLECPHNALRALPKLPPALQLLNCSNNRLDRLPALPATLVVVNCSGNRLTALPPLPSNLRYLNYWRNPALARTLAPVFRARPCPDPKQNCLPNALIGWNILHAKITDTTSTFSALKVVIAAQHSWGVGSEEETVHFKQIGGRLVADSVRIHKSVPGYGTRRPVDTTYFRPASYAVSQEFIQQVVKDIYTQKLVFDTGPAGGGQVLDLTTKRMEKDSYGCKDCNYYAISYVLYGLSGPVHLSYRFDSLLGAGPVGNPPTSQVQTELLDWLYMYKLTNATLPDNETVRFFFKPQHLRKVLQWTQ